MSRLFDTEEHSEFPHVFFFFQSFGYSDTQRGKYFSQLCKITVYRLDYTTYGNSFFTSCLKNAETVKTSLNLHKKLNRMHKPRSWLGLWPNIKSTRYLTVFIFAIFVMLLTLSLYSVVVLYDDNLLLVVHIFP